MPARETQDFVIGVYNRRKKRQATTPRNAAGKDMQVGELDKQEPHATAPDR